MVRMCRSQRSPSTKFSILAFFTVIFVTSEACLAQSGPEAVRQLRRAIESQDVTVYGDEELGGRVTDFRMDCTRLIIDYRFKGRYRVEGTITADWRDVTLQATKEADGEYLNRLVCLTSRCFKTEETRIRNGSEKEVFDRGGTVKIELDPPELASRVLSLFKAVNQSCGRPAVPTADSR